MRYSSEIQNAFYRAKLKGAKFFSIGKSFLGRDILACHVGSTDGPQILIQGAIHAREHITTLLCCRQIEYLISKEKQNHAVLSSEVLSNVNLSCDIVSSEALSSSVLSSEIQLSTSLSSEALPSAALFSDENILFKNIEQVIENNRKSSQNIKDKQQNKKALEYGGVYVIPMVNPDGVDICFNGSQNVRCRFVRERIDEILESNNQELFKANANLVDLNVNFDADWGKGKLNVKSESTENYIGFKPESEKETRALKRFTEIVQPSLTISYHAKGEVIYYKYESNKETLKSTKVLAKIAQKFTGYKLASQGKSSGGYKDYCLKKLNIPSLTIEVGDDNLAHPLTKACLPKILQQNLKLPLILLEKLNNLC